MLLDKYGNKLHELDEVYYLELISNPLHKESYVYNVYKGSIDLLKEYDTMYSITIRYNNNTKSRTFKIVKGIKITEDNINELIKRKGDN